MKFFLKSKILLPMFLLAAGLVLSVSPTAPDTSPDSTLSPSGRISSPEIQTPDNSQEHLKDAVPYPTGALFYTQERLDYQDGDMILEIPRLNLRCPVLSGTGGDVLAKGVGLYEMAQPPGQINENVSIAGYRDFAGMEFYSIDAITNGDKMYLEYAGKRYEYEYAETVVVDDDDWLPIYCRDFSSITLTSCDPIGVASHRIIVVGSLMEVTASPTLST